MIAIEPANIKRILEEIVPDKELLWHDDDRDDYNRGWNDCIDYILNNYTSYKNLIKDEEAEIRLIDAERLEKKFFELCDKWDTEQFHIDAIVDDIIGNAPAIYLDILDVQN